MKINNVDELREDLQAQGYGDYMILNQATDTLSSKEIDYIPKTDKFLIQNLSDGILTRMSVAELEKSDIGVAMREGNFFKRVR